jgi:hypothetical protein
MFRLAADVILPANAPTQKFAYVGMNGSGKSYGAGVMVEEFLLAGVQVVIIDPVGIWWGLRVAADGRGRGIDIPVFGGYHGDVPLEPTGGDLVARLVAERGMSMVLDVSDFTGGQQTRFVQVFAETLFNLKKRNRSVLHLVWDEGHEFFPQQFDAGQAPMVGQTKRLWKIGRNYGIGGSIITPRVAEANKGALNLCDYLITGRTKAPNDIKVIDAWANSNGDGEGDVAISLLPTQSKGFLTVWGDHGPEGPFRFRPKRTLDSSKTPESGDAHQGQSLPAISMDEIRAAMAATIEEAKANDPKALRDEIARLRAELGGANAGGAAVERDRWRGEFHRVDGELHELRKALDGATGAEVRRLRAMEKRFDQVIAAIDGYRADGEGKYAKGDTSAPRWTEEDDTRMVSGDFTPPAPANGSRRPAPAPEPRPPAGSDGDGAARMLRALASFHPKPLTKSQLGTLAIMKVTGGSFARYMSRLRTEHLVTSDGGLVSLTAAGLKAAGPVSKPESPRALLALWKGKLTGKARDMLDVLAAEGAPLTKAALAARVDMDVGGGSFARYMSALRSNGLMVKTSGGFRAVESLSVR